MIVLQVIRESLVVKEFPVSMLNIVLALIDRQSTLEVEDELMFSLCTQFIVLINVLLFIFISLHIQNMKTRKDEVQLD